MRGLVESSQGCKQAYQKSFNVFVAGAGKRGKKPKIRAGMLRMITCCPELRAECLQCFGSAFIFDMRVLDRREEVQSIRRSLSRPVGAFDVVTITR